MVEIIGKKGKVPNTYRERSRWTDVENVSELEIPAFAPCLFILGWNKELRQAKHMLVAPFVGERGREPAVVRDGVEVLPVGYAAANPHVAFNGAIAIPPKGRGQVTSDYPVVARVSINESVRSAEEVVDDTELGVDEEEGEPDPDVEVEAEEEPEIDTGQLDAFDTLFIDRLSVDFKSPVAQLSNFGVLGLDYQEGDAASLTALSLKFSAVALANEEESLYWIMPTERFRRNPVRYRRVAGVVSDQQIVSQIPMSGNSADKLSWGGVDSDGAIVFRLPGVYTLDLTVLASGTQDDAQDEMNVLEQSVNLELESLSDFYVTPDENEFHGGGNSSTSVIVQQPSLLRRINCSVVDECPKMDVFRSSISTQTTIVFQVSVTKDWKPPKTGKEHEAEPIARIKVSRKANADFTQTISALNLEAFIARFGFGESYLMLGTTGLSAPGFFSFSRFGKYRGLGQLDQW